MILSFNIEYRTNWGEEVRISGLFPESIPLHTTDGIYWTAELELEVPQEGMTINYSYQIEQNGIVIRKEWDSFSRSIFLSGSSRKIYRINDCWKNIPEQLYLYSSAFTEALLAHPEKENIPQRYKKGLVIKAYAPRINKDYCLAICGNQKSLGHWDPEKAVLMSDTNFPEWQIELDASKLKYPLEYKFILYNKQEKKADCWEKNPNRYLADPELKTNETLVISDRYVYFDIPAWKGAGIAIPVFSLKSEKSFGVGDFGDLKRMVDWAVNTRQKVIQILPVNDTTMTHAWTDSYPYNSISIYAFHPMYADIRQMGTLKDKEAASKFSKKQKELNSLPAIDYEAVNQTKWEFFNLLFRQEGEKVLASKGFKDFFETNKEWLQPYAVFSYLRDAYKTPNFRQWPQHSVYQAEDIEKMCQPGTADYPHISLYYYIQYHLHLQLLSATEYARQHGVVLKGDIPIGISRNSVEAWTEPHYFNLNGQAGAPPDDFSINGQNWGFPTYNWDVMEKDGYRWWMKRFQKMAEYFDAYRIDHILGFFRIWEIPMHAVHGLLGQFDPSLPMSREEIESYGLTFRDEYLLPFIHESFLGQLFGPHTHLVKQENDLRILSLEIQRMPKNPMHEFGHLNEYPYRSVCTISTHDMSTLRGWWEEDYQQTQRYYNATLGHYGVAPTTATPELCEEIVRNHLNSNSILCILSFQDWLSIDGKWRNPNVAEERINVPSNPRNYWRYRMHLTLEQLMKAKTLNDKIGELIKYTGRDPNK